MHVLTTEQRHFFEREGWLLVDGVLDPARDLTPVMDEYAQVLDGLVAELLAGGQLRSAHQDLPFIKRLIQVCVETKATYGSHFDISLPQANCKPDHPCHFGPAVFRVLAHPRLLDLAEDLLGPEIYSNPVQHVRIKLPLWAIPEGGRNGLVSAVPWHQDQGVVLPEADETDMLTVWLPLGDTTAENGCLQVVPRSHYAGLIQHCREIGVGIPEAWLPGEPVTVPVKAGSVLLMHRLTVHRSLENMTNGVRWSFDLRYQPIGQPTGRGVFPGFVARSRANPTAELHDPVAWKESWMTARAVLSNDPSRAFNRWAENDPACA